jgi:hypothetical protein
MQSLLSCLVVVFIVLESFQSCSLVAYELFLSCLAVLLVHSFFSRLQVVSHAALCTTKPR